VYGALSLLQSPPVGERRVNDRLSFAWRGVGLTLLRVWGVAGEHLRAVSLQSVARVTGGHV
jgi:hypothetical protein